MNEAALSSTHPVGYKEFEVGFAVGLITDPNKTPLYYQVVNKEAIPWIEKSDNAWWDGSGTFAALGTGTTVNIGDISDFLEPAVNSLYVLKMGIFSMPELIDVQISVPAATQLYGIKNSNTGQLNGMTSPLYNPTTTVYCFGTSLIPHFTLVNNGNTLALSTTIGFIKLGFSGYRYHMEPLSEAPSTVHIINLTPMGAE
jgi:hypothetical protein